MALKPSPHARRALVRSTPSVSDQLPALLQATRNLYVASVELSADAEPMLSIVRRLFVTAILDERPTVAVVGLQGAGKSTLTSALYPPVSGMLPENVGRGEKLPIRIVERSGCGSPEAAVYAVDESAPGAPVVRTTIDPGSIGERAQNPRREDLILEIAVEPRWFGGGDACLLLLPGFEDRTHAWDTIARYAAENAAACILCVEPTRLAEESNHQIIKDVVDDLSRGRAVVALTKSDTDPQHNVGHRATFMDTFKVPPSASGRVVCTGAAGLGIDELARQLTVIAPPARVAHSHALAALEALIEQDLGQVLAGLRTVRAGLRSEEREARVEIEEKLKPFDDAASSLRAKYADSLRGALRVRVEDARRQIEREIVDEDVLDKLFSTLFGASLADQIAFRERIEAAWNPAAVREEHAVVVANVVAGQFGVEAASPRRIAAYGETPSGAQLTGQAATDLALLMRSQEQLPRDLDLALVFRVLPAVTLEYARLAHVHGEVFRADAGPSKGRVGDIIQDFEGAGQTQKNLFSLIGGFLVLDGAWDGKIDSLPNLARALGFSAGGAAGGAQAAGGAAAAAGVVSTPVLAAAGAIVVGVGAVLTARHVNRADVERASAAQRAFAGVAEATVASSLVQYDEAMARVKSALVRRLEVLHGVDARTRRVWHADLALATATEARAQMLEAIRGEQSLF